MLSLIASRPSVPAATRSVAAVLCAAVLVGSAGIGFAQTPKADPVVASVGGTEIRESDVRLADEDFGRSLPYDDPEKRRDYLVTFLTDLTILYKAAVDRNVVDEADIQRRVEFTRKKALMTKLLEVTAKNSVTEENVRKKYEEVIANVKTEPEYHIRAILFRFPNASDKAAVQAAEEKAKAAIKRLEKGDDFAAVAVELSDNESAKQDGGELGYRTKIEMGKEYAEVVPGMKNGAVSRPIWTEFGWHVVKREDERVRKPADFDAIHDRLGALIARQSQLALIEDLRKQVKVERFDKSAQPTPAAGAGAAPTGK